jgi:hypothetical protein
MYSASRVAGEGFQIVEGVKASPMAIAEFKLYGIAANWLPAGNKHTWERSLATPSMNLASKISFADILGAGRVGTEVLHLIKVFTSIGPTDGDFISDQLDVLRHEHC